MTMTHEEIVRHYQQAANQKQDIQVLADLNGTDTASIRAVLIDAGVLTPDRPSKAVFDEQIAPLAAQGMDDNSIAASVGCSAQTVRNYRKRHNIPKPETPAEAASALAPSQGPAPGIYGRLETIIAALPSDSSDEARNLAGRLCLSLFGDYLADRLMLEVEA